MDLAAAEKGLGSNPGTIMSWESGKADPTLAGLQKLSSLYRRPLAALLLGAPPADPLRPPDYRTFDGAQQTLSRDSLVAVRRAQWIVEKYKDLELPIRADPSVALESAGAADEKMETVAEALRQRLRVSLSDQQAWADPYEALRVWRERVESIGIIVLQLPMPLAEIRGFSLASSLPRLICLNRSDAIRARSFTLFHEVGHVLIGSGGLCLPFDSIARSGAAAEERQCNDLAGAVLVPENQLRALVAGRELDANIEDASLESLAGRFQVSKEVLWYRLRRLDLISEQTFSEKWPTWRKRWGHTPTSGGAAETAVQRTIRQLGRGLVQPVLQAEQVGAVPAQQAAELLGIRAKDLAALRVFAEL
jgi:Zn-dependent peptidase ImmA (M78 family)